jgi:pimeloyl-ACP methyl ester carboxylesterase
VTESRVALDGRTWAVRQSGDPHGAPLVYFHSTPSCRLEPAFADAVCGELGVRLVCFDRPGYGGSTPQPFGLASVATATAAIADRLGLDRFATLGQSGGGPFSLACAAVLGERVTRAGVTAGAVPFQLMPSAAASRLDDDDRAAIALLPDREAAAAAFARAFEPLRVALQGRDADILAGMRRRGSAGDQRLLDRPETAAVLVASRRASMASGTSGGAWDNVAWVGPWDVDLADVRRPVHLWYGDDDPIAAEGAGQWLADHLPDATLHEWPGGGHLAVVEHVAEVLRTLAAD